MSGVEGSGGPWCRFLASGNRSPGRRVVQDVREIGTGRVVAAVVAVGVVLAGCAPGDGGGSTTTAPSSPVAEGPVSPWDLPLEERPPLFDPCEEIPVEAVEEGAGRPVEPMEDLENNLGGELISCGWKTDEIHIAVLSTWKSKSEYKFDPAYEVEDGEIEVAGRSGMQLVRRSLDPDMHCYAVFFTSQGTFWINVIVSNSLGRFQGEKFRKACDVLKTVAGPIVSNIPEGDFL